MAATSSKVDDLVTATKCGSKTSSTSSLPDKNDRTLIDGKHPKPSSDDLVDEEPTPFRWTSIFFKGKKYNPIDLDAVATRRSVYDDPVLAEHYMPTAKYENLHRFDISARWTYREEKVSPTTGSAQISRLIFGAITGTGPED